MAEHEAQAADDGLPVARFADNAKEAAVLRTLPSGTGWAGWCRYPSCLQLQSRLLAVLRCWSKKWSIAVLMMGSLSKAIGIAHIACINAAVVRVSQAKRLNIHCS